MAKTTISLKFPQSTIDQMKHGPIPASKIIDGVVAHASIHDVVKALLTRYEKEEPPEHANVCTSATVSPQSLRNLEHLSIKTGILKDPLVRLLLEHHLHNLE